MVLLHIYQGTCKTFSIPLVSRAFYAHSFGVSVHNANIFVHMLLILPNYKVMDTSISAYILDILNLHTEYLTSTICNMATVSSPMSR